MSRFFFGPMGWCVVSAILFGVSPTACRRLLDVMDPIALAALLYLGAGIGTLPMSIRKGLRPKKIPRTDAFRLLGAIFMGGVLGPIFLMKGIESAGAGTSSLLLNFETVATVLLGFLFFKEHIGKSVGIASGLIVVAGCWLGFPGQLTLHPGVLWVIGACFCWGMDNHLTAVIDQITPAQSTCIKGLCAGTFNVLLAVALSQSFGDTTSMAGALLIGAVCYGLSIVLYIASAQQLGATRSQMIFATAPYFGLFTAWIFLAEPVLISQVGAAALMALALFFLHREQHAHAHTHTSTKHTHLHHHADDHHDHNHSQAPRTVFGWHAHPHAHAEETHTHEHRSDIHHRHH